MTKFRTFLLVAFGLLCAVVAAEAHDYQLGALKIGHPWARATAPTAPTGGGFLSVTNTGTVPDRLVSAQSVAAEIVQIHEMKMDGDVMRMREVGQGLEIPAGATITLAPGSFHLMMMGLKGPLKQGNKVPLTLVFEKAGKIDVELAIEGMGASHPAQNM